MKIVVGCSPAVACFRSVFPASETRFSLFSVCLLCLFCSNVRKVNKSKFFCSREPELVLLDMQSVPAGQEGWLAFVVTSACNHWLLHPRSNLGIRLYVETEEGEAV